MSSARRGEFLGHPKGLFVLFFTEMWERFSYYGMRALLMLYMVNYFKWSQEQASSVYKWYTSLVYLTPLLGGYLADRWLGNKKAIIIGASLMAIGHFCMAFEQHSMFYAALIFLIIGNGFFKPNMSTQVGRLYSTNDPRRDSAYTIFYMGINLGAFLSPLVCGWLRDNTKWGYHAGFAAAGVGMVLGLMIYLLFINWVEEIPEADAVPESADGAKQPDSGEGLRDPEKPAAGMASVVPALAKASPVLLVVLGVAAVVGASVAGVTGALKADNAFAFGVGGGFACFMGAWIVSQLKLAVRDRVLAIYFVGVFVVFFWVAFEQAGNAMNMHADKTTQRYLTEPAPEPSIYPTIEDPDAPKETGPPISERISKGLNPLSEGWFQSFRPIIAGVTLLLLIWLWFILPMRGHDLSGLAAFGFSVFFLACGAALLIWTPTLESIRKAFNPVTTEWFQSINALAIFLLAPLFAWMWVFLPRHGINLSIPGKVAIGVFLQGMAVMLMLWSVGYENQASRASLAELPFGVWTDDQNRVVFRDAPDLGKDKDLEAYLSGEVDRSKPGIVHGGRILHEPGSTHLDMSGVLSDTDRDRMLRATVPPAYLKAAYDLAEASRAARRARLSEDEAFSVSVLLEEIPPGFDLRFAGFKPGQVTFDPDTMQLTTTTELLDKDYKSLLVAAADPALRDALNELYVTSAAFKISSWWLFWFYILCTLGELCLSPVGLSMVSKLAPAKFATMLMGMWLLTSFFGNFIAGLLGEFYGRLHPVNYFLYIGGALLIVSFIAFLAVKKITAMMHGVR